MKMGKKLNALDVRLAPISDELVGKNGCPHVPVPNEDSNGIMIRNLWLDRQVFMSCLFVSRKTLAAARYSTNIGQFGVVCLFHLATFVIVLMTLPIDMFTDR